MKAVLAVFMLALVVVTSVYAAKGNIPLTQMASVVHRIAITDTTNIGNLAFTGVVGDAKGVAYATTSEAVLRIPASVTTQASADNINYAGLWTNGPDSYAPCIPQTNPPPSEYYNCSSGVYAGENNIYALRVGAGGSGLPRAYAFSLPFLHADRLWAVAQSPVPALISWQKYTFSSGGDASYNPVTNGGLTGAFQLFQSDTHVFIASSAEGNTVLLRYELARLTDVSYNPDQISIVGAKAVDVTPSPDFTTFFFVGSFGDLTNSSAPYVWSIPETAFNGADIEFTTLTTKSALGPFGPSPATINYDASGIFVACTGNNDPTVGIPPTVLRFSLALGLVNQTMFILGEAGLAGTSLIDPASGVIYWGTTALADDDGYNAIYQFSAVGFYREGRVDTPDSAVAVSAMAWAKVNSVAAPSAPDFYTVGIDTNTQFGVLVRWSAAENCGGNCNNHGTCTRRVCGCEDVVDPLFVQNNQTGQWNQPWCATRPCVNDCTGNGQCNNGSCSCDSIWTSVGAPAIAPCSVRQCPYNCTDPKNGVCQYDATNPALPLGCNCLDGWQGDACSLKAKLLCHYLTNNCTACVDNPACGWCASSKTCFDGDRDGPAVGLNLECRSWFWASCPSPAISIVNYIITAIFGLVLVIGLISGLLIDTASDDPERRTEWYTFQRAGKVWSMVYQLQLVAAAGLINISFPTSFVAFTRYWNWILLAWGFPWQRQNGDSWYDSTAETSGRALKNVAQYQTYWKASDNEIFFTWLIWFGVCLGIFLVLYAVLLVVSIVRGGRTGFIARTRPGFIALRVIELGHLGLCILGPISILKGGASAVVGGIIWALVGVLLPIGLYIWLGFIKDKKDLFAPKFAGTCYPFYGAFDFRYRNMLIVPWGRRILVGIFIGFIATSKPVGTLIALVIIHALYFVFVIIFRAMYSDYLQRYLEIILAGINLVAFAMLFGYLGTPSVATSNAVGIIFIVLQFIGATLAAAFFFVSWLQMNQVYSLGQCFKFCTCRGGGDPK